MKPRISFIDQLVCAHGAEGRGGLYYVYNKNVYLIRMIKLCYSPCCSFVHVNYSSPRSDCKPRCQSHYSCSLPISSRDRNC